MDPIEAVEVPIGNAHSLVFRDKVSNVDVDGLEPLGMVYHLPVPVLDREPSHKERVLFPLLMINGVADVQFHNPYTLMISRALAVDWEDIIDRIDVILVEFVAAEFAHAEKTKQEPRGILTESILKQAQDEARRAQFGGNPPQGAGGIH